MDLDELSAAIRQASEDPVATKLSELLVTWKDNRTNVNELENTVERYIGNTWIASESEHKTIYGLWSRFRDGAIHGIGGMTMSERLCHFSLFHRWECSKDDEDQKTIYAKLLANP